MGHVFSGPKVPLQGGLSAHFPWWSKNFGPSLTPSMPAVVVWGQDDLFPCSLSPSKPQGDLFLPLTTPSYFLQFFYVNHDTD